MIIFEKSNNNFSIIMNWTKAQISVVGVVAMTSFFSTFLISSVNIALPAIEKEFMLDAVTLSWVVTAFLLASAMFLLPMGKLADLAGVRQTFRVGVLIFTIGSLLCGLSNSGSWVIASRFLQGIGSALSSTTGPAILVSAFSAKNRGRVLGISVSAVYLGLATGPFAGGLLTQYLGWRSLFFSAFALGLIIVFLAFAFLGEDEQTRKGNIKPDMKGTFFYMAGLVALVFGSSRIPGLQGWAIMVSGVVSLIIFWIIESRSQTPVFNTQLFTRNRLFAFSNIAALINYSSTFAIVFLLSLYLQKIKGLSPFDAGTILIAQPVVMAVFSPVTGRLSDKIQPRYLATLGMVILATGLLAFVFLESHTPITLIAGILVWVGLGFALFSSPNMNTIMSSVDRSQLATASGTSATMRVVGQMLSMTIAALVFAVFFGNQAIKQVSEPLFLWAMKSGFFIFSLISLSGVYFSFGRGTMHRPD